MLSPRNPLMSPDALCRLAIAVALTEEGRPWFTYLATVRSWPGSGLFTAPRIPAY